MGDTAMQYRTLGRTGLRVSLASLGTGGDSRLGQATHGNREDSLRVVRRALELGINLFDTAPIYMDSEQLLGAALQGVPRESYYLSTKVVPRRRRALATPHDVVASCEESLRQLRTDYVDILLFHGVTYAEYPGVRDMLLPVVSRLQERGLVRFVGLTEPMPGAARRRSFRSARLSRHFIRSLLRQRSSERALPPTHARLRYTNGTTAAPGFPNSDGHEVMTHAADDAVWDVAMLKYGILDQSAARAALPAARAANLGVMNMSSVRGPLVIPAQLEALIKDWKGQRLVDPGALPETDPLGFLVHDGVPSVMAAGYRFVMEEEAVSTVLIGTGSVAHLEESVRFVLDGPLPATDSARLRQLFGEIIIERD